MALPKIATVINFCSNDYPFLKECIAHVKGISSQILIPVCDHFFDGVAEDKQLLQSIYKENEEATFLEYAWEDRGYPSFYWHNLSRVIGAYFTAQEMEYILFLDTDEIVDEDRFREWIEGFALQKYTALRLANYWYFRETTYQATIWEHTPLLVRKERIHGETLFSPKERNGAYYLTGGEKKDHVLSLDGKPMIHHYSWVRTEEQMKRKVSSWSHNTERNWMDLVDKEFSRPFNGKDFVHGYEFKEVDSFVQICLQDRPQASTLPARNVTYMNQKQTAAIDLSVRFNIPIPLCI